MRLTRLLSTGFCAVLLVVAGSASGLQFNPTGNERLHTLGSGQAGAAWNTGGVGSGITGGQVSYDSGTTRLTMTGEVDVLNWYDEQTPDPSCPTNVGSNCTLNFAPNLTFTLLADLVGVTATPLGFGFFTIVTSYGTTGGVDLTVKEGTTTVLEATLASGTFGTTTTNGLESTVIYDSNNGTAFSNPTAFGVLDVSPSSTYADLFDDGANNLFGIQVGSIFDYAPTLDSLLANVFAGNPLQSFTAEAEGEVFRADNGEFNLPEPGIGLLVVTGLGGLALAGRRRRSR